MNRVIRGIVLGCGIMALSGGMFAQDYGQDRSRFQREGSWDHDRMVREYRGAFYDRLQSDLARAEQRGYLRGDDFRRFNVARREVGDFSAKWSRGIFDPREMDRAIGSVQRVADIRALRPDDRDALMDDLHRMREFRAHMEGRR